MTEYQEQMLVADEKTPTGNRWLDDLSWIPTGDVYTSLQKCRVCTFTTVLQVALKQHVQTHRKEILAPSLLQRPMKAGDEVTYRCRFCDLSTGDVDDFYRHCTSHTGEYLFACCYCSFRGVSLDEMKRHNVDLHPGRNDSSVKTNDKAKQGSGPLYGYMCSYCCFLQLNERKVKNHTERAHAPRVVEVIRLDMAKKLYVPCRPPPPPAPPPSPPPPPVAAPIAPPLPLQPLPPANILVPEAAMDDGAAAAAQLAVSFQAGLPSELPTTIQPYTAGQDGQLQEPVAKPPGRRAPVKIRDDPRRAVSKLGDGTITADPDSTTTGRRKSTKASPGPKRKQPPKEKTAGGGGARGPRQVAAAMGDSSDPLPQLGVFDDDGNMPPGMLVAEEVVVPLELGTMTCEVEEPVVDPGADGDLLLNESFGDGCGVPDAVKTEPMDSSQLNQMFPDCDSDDSTDTIVMRVGATTSMPSRERTGSLSSLAPDITRVKSEPVQAVECPGVTGSVNGSGSGVTGSSAGGIRSEESTPVRFTATQDSNRLSESVPALSETISKLQAKLQGASQAPTVVAAQVVQASPSTAAPTASANNGQVSSSGILASSSDTVPDSAPYFVDNAGRKVQLTPAQLQDWSERRKAIVCSCLFVARSIEAFLRHREVRHKGEKKCMCPECHHRFDTAISYAEHLWSSCAKPRIFVCVSSSLCRFMTSNPVNLSCHTKDKHAGVAWLPCYWCHVRYGDVDCLGSHIQSKCTIREPMMYALMSQPTNHRPSPGLSTGGNKSVAAGRPLLSTAVSSRRESSQEIGISSLEIVYRCSVPQCSHRSLEAGVFIDHVQVDHPEKTVHVCHDCGENYHDLLSLAVHIGECHREVHQVPAIAAVPAEDTADASTAAAKVVAPAAVGGLVPHAAGSQPQAHTPVSGNGTGVAALLAGHSLRPPNDMTVHSVRLPNSRLLPTGSSAGTPQRAAVNSGTDIPVSVRAQPPTVQEPSSRDRRESSPPANGCSDPVQADQALLLTNKLVASKVSGPTQNADSTVVVHMKPVEDICKMLALTCEVLLTSNLDAAQLKQMMTAWSMMNRNKKGKFQITDPIVIDPLRFIVGLKTATALSATLAIPALIDLYKCPGRECSFTCSDEDEFQCHLDLGKCHNADRLLQCVYCGERQFTVWGAVAHMSQQHGRTMYQCPDCIFRSRLMLFAILHIALEHPGRQGNARVYVCRKSNKGDGSQDSSRHPEELPSLLSIIPPIPCTFAGCAFMTMDPLDYVQHLTSSHSSSDTWDCFFCGLSVKVQEAREHLPRHNIYRFHCRFCGYGAHNGNDIVIHLCRKHPHATGRVFIRNFDPPRNPVTTSQ